MDDKDIIIGFLSLGVFIIGILCYGKGKNDAYNENQIRESARAKLKEDMAQKETIAELKSTIEIHNSQIKYLKEEILALDNLFDTHLTLLAKGKK